MKVGDKLPQVTFQTRVRDEAVGGPNPFRWEAVTTDDYFKGKRVVLFSLPGAFTPTCSTYQLPGFEKAANEMAGLGVDAIYCLSVNDSFVMNQWAKAQGLDNVKVIPDGSGEFTQKVGMLVRKDNLGFGPRSWRYAAIIDAIYAGQDSVDYRAQITYENGQTGIIERRLSIRDVKGGEGR